MGDSDGTLIDFAGHRAASRIVSLSEFALIVRRSETSIRQFIREHPEFPIVERGSNGVAYQIDIDVALPWWKAHHESISEAEAERRRQLDIWSREMYGKGQEDRPDGLTPKERRELAEAAKTEDYVRIRRGELIDRAEFVELLSIAIVTLRKELLQVPSAYCRERGFPRDERLALERMLRDRINRLAEVLSTTKGIRNLGERSD